MSFGPTHKHLVDLANEVVFDEASAACGSLPPRECARKRVLVETLRQLFLKILEKDWPTQYKLCQQIELAEKVWRSSDE